VAQQFCPGFLLQHSIAFAVLTVAIAEYVMWILEQKGWINP
jgi:hypothetical protein